MGIYIFTYKQLRKYLIADAKKKDSKHDFGMNIIPDMLADGKKLFAYEFKGYWKDVGTVDSLWEANMDLLNPKNDLDLYNEKRDWKIYGEDTLSKPQIIGENGSVVKSIVTQGATIDGEVSGSVIYSNVYIGSGAKVIDSVLLPGVVVEEGAVVKKAIVDQNVTIGSNVVINKDGKDVELVAKNVR